MPINNPALGTLPPDKAKGASGLYNLMRDLGGAVGLVVINTLLTNRRALQYERLSESITWANDEAQRQLDRMARKVTAHWLEGQVGALAQMARPVMGQAAVKSFIDIFVIITALFSTLTIAALLMKAPPKDVKVGAH